MKQTATLIGTLIIVFTANAGAQPADLTSREEMESFLQQAKVIRSKELSVGVTRSKKLTMSDGRLTHAAHFQSVNVYKPRFDSRRGTELNFKDSYKYNIAAYRLDKLLKLNMVPVSVERKVSGYTGALTWWVDNVAMMERERIKKKLTPPKPYDWVTQMQKVQVFNELVYNTDANLGNLLVTESWELRMIDFTRAFRVHKKLRDPQKLTRIDSGLYETLRGLNAETLERELGAYLSDPELEGLLARRDRILDHFDRLVAQSSPRRRAAVASREGENH